MTTTGGSVKKPNVFNDANEALYESSSDFIEDHDHSVDVPWPEWNDADLNAEAWEEHKPSRNTRRGSLFPSVITYYEDPQLFELPLLIRDEVRSWKRPHEVFPDTELTVYSSNDEKLDLWVPSLLSEFDFYRYFNEILQILQFYALKYGFPVEAETPTFFANTQGEPWQPWHHIYALCKAGKGQIHKPVYCPYGKYVVRLFYMGCWRKFIIDDRIPCDSEGLCMLPCTRTPGELWPIILTKVIFKIMFLTPSINLFSIDFNIISVFTGWTCVKFTTENKTKQQLWRRLFILLPKFVLPEDEIHTKNPSASENQSSKKEVKYLDKKIDQPNEKFCFLLANLEKFPEEETLFTTTLALTMIRDIPLVKAVKKEATKMWKRIRWVYWAKEKGVWIDELKLLPYRRVFYISYITEIYPLLEANPQHETTLYETPNENEAGSDELFTETEHEPEQWCDFYKLCEYLTNISVYLKPSFFNFKFEVNCFLKNASKKITENTTTSGKTALKAPPQPQNIYYIPLRLKTFGNKPAFLFCESLSEIVLVFCLSVCPQKKKIFFGYLKYDEPDFLKIGHACLMVENYDWKTIRQEDILGSIKTVGSSSFILNIKPGRHILKLWIDSDSPYFVNIYSNTDFGVYKGPKIRFMMKNEAERIIAYINKVSNAFIELTQKFGTSELSNALKAFYSAIKPGNTSLPEYIAQLDNFIEIFIRCLTLTLKSLVQTEEDLKIMIGALRSLFMNPKIGCEILHGSAIFVTDDNKKAGRKPVIVLKERTFSEFLSLNWTFNEINQIKLIQRIFRGYRVRLLKKRQQPSRKEYKPYVERLKKICDLVFAPVKRELEVGKLIRRMIMTNYSLLKTFSFYNDFHNVIEVEEFTGKINDVEPYAWVPLTRLLIANHSDEAVPCAFYLSCNLEQYVIQGVDNDTNEELFRLTTSVSPYYYRNNVKGYTIFVFSWNQGVTKTINWRLEMVRMKHFQVIHLCNTLLSNTCHPYSLPNLEVFEIKNFYIPNHKNRICRCLIKVHKRTLLTLRLSTSFKETQFAVTISLDKKFCPTSSESTEITDKVIARAHGSNGSVMLLSVFLEFYEPNVWWEDSVSDEPTIYIVEAFVLNNSWPLTNQEWGVVETIRVNNENWKESSTSISSRKGTLENKKKSRMSKRLLLEQKHIENPFWSLQVVFDASETQEPNEGIVIEEDKSYAESVRRMKLMWEKRNPGRRKKGKDLRHNFLQKEFSKMREEVEEGGEDDISIKSQIEMLGSFHYLINDQSNIRYLKSPRILPKLPTLELLKKYKKPRKTKSSNTGTIRTDLGFYTDIDSDLESNLNVPNGTGELAKEYLDRCYRLRQIMVNYLTDEQILSTQLTEQGYEERQKAVERLGR